MKSFICFLSLLVICCADVPDTNLAHDDEQSVQSEADMSRDESSRLQSEFQADASGANGNDAEGFADVDTGSSDNSDAGESSSDDAAAISDTGADTAASEPSTPFFYFVVHADPAVGRSLFERWDNLELFMATLTDRNDRLPEEQRHHITIMFTANWGRLIQSDRGKQRLVAQWIGEGHEMAFHSHTHNHQFLDGYTNSDRFGPDDPNKCPGDAELGECSLDYGLGVG